MFRISDNLTQKAVLSAQCENEMDLGSWGDSYTLSGRVSPVDMCFKECHKTLATPPIKKWGIIPLSLPSDWPWDLL